MRTKVFKREGRSGVAVNGAEACPSHVGDLLRQDFGVEHQRTLAQGLVGLAEGVSRHLVERGKVFDPEVLAQQVADMAWAGLRAVHRNA